MLQMIPPKITSGTGGEKRIAETRINDMALSKSTDSSCLPSTLASSFLTPLSVPRVSPSPQVAFPATSALIPSVGGGGAGSQEVRLGIGTGGRAGPALGRWLLGGSHTGPR